VNDYQKGEGGETGGGGLEAPVSPPNLRMTGANISQAHGVMTKLFHPFLARI
jgi:hypothetical protein